MNRRSFFGALFWLPCMSAVSARATPLAPSFVGLNRLMLSGESGPTMHIGGRFGKTIRVSVSNPAGLSRTAALQQGRDLAHI